MVGTTELVRLASARSPCGTVPLVAAIETVIMPVAAPAPGHTALVGTREGGGRACVICEGAQSYILIVFGRRFSDL